MPLKPSETVERNPKSLIEVEASGVDSEKDVIVLALENEDSQLRDFVCVLTEPLAVDILAGSKKRSPTAGPGGLG